MDKVNKTRLEENQTSLGRLLVNNFIDRAGFINYEDNDIFKR